MGIERRGDAIGRARSCRAAVYGIGDLEARSRIEELRRGVAMLSFGVGVEL